MDKKAEEEGDGLPEIYLSPSRSGRMAEASRPSSDTDPGTWEESDSEIWIPLPAEATITSELTTESHTSYLGQREEIEGGSSQESQNTSLIVIGNQETEGRDRNRIITSSGAYNPLGQDDVRGRDSRLTGQRGETPGSDCPPMANLGAFARALRRPLVLDTQVGAAGSSELVFSPGGDQGFMVVPAPLTPLDDSCSDSEALDWMAAYGALGGVPALVPVRDAVEGADDDATDIQSYLGSGGGIVTGGERERLERNSPAGLSTPDGDLDMVVASNRPVPEKRLELTRVRPPVVGQSEEVEVVERKDLGSTDGEESGEDGQIRLPPRSTDLFCPTDTQPGSLGSQSENTDSVKTVVDLNRGEVQGCESDIALDSQGLLMAATTQLCPKPSFVVGGPISPRGKFKQFQNTVRDRMQDMKASLETQENEPELDRERYLAQPPLYPAITLVSEQEVSLASMISVESTNHPDSSERVTSPSVLSVSSAASSRRMEWDSGADVGYSGGATGGTPEAALTSFSTLERIAIGSYASVLRTEPEGTTQVKERQRLSKRGGRLGSGRLGAQIVGSKQNAAMDTTTGSSTHSSPSHRAQQVYVSSSEDDFSYKMASPAQSPRRRPRRRSLVTGSRDGDSPHKRLTKAHPGLGRRLRELAQEHHEGKSSSLVELGQVDVNKAKHSRSTSQYSLSLPHHLFHHFKSESNKSEGRGVAGAVNTSTSTSTLIPSISPQPASASNSSTHVADPLLPPHSPSSTNSRHSSLSSLAVTESRQAQIHTSSSYNHSPRSHDSSDLDGWEARERVHSHNLKARKNSENARNHEYLARKGNQTGLEKREEHDMEPTRSLTPTSNGPHQVERWMEESSGESMQASNLALQSLSVRLLGRIQTLGEAGCLGQGRDYHKLKDYATFIGVPAATDEERRLRQGVANVIMRMFGEIGGLDHTSDTSHASDTLHSDAFNSANSNTLPSDTLPTAPSDTSDTQSGRVQALQDSGNSLLSSRQFEDTSDPISHDKKEEEVLKNNPPSSELIPEADEVVNQRSSSEPIAGSRVCGDDDERCATPGGTVVVVPYRPPSATRTYYMAVSHDPIEGLLEGERERGSVSPPSHDSPLPGDVWKGHRGEGGGSALPPPTPAFTSHTDQLLDLVGVDREAWGDDYGGEGSGGAGSGGGDGGGGSEWWEERPGGGGVGVVAAHSPTTSEELSPAHRPSWQLLPPSSWPEEEGEERERAVADWWARRGDTGRLYQDRHGTFHIAQQPPGYQEDRDSHPSESASDHDRHRPAPPRPPWTSSGSESAYETIRERHRRVDEALASSFEFYSTSPRPARLMSCTPPSVQEDEVDLDSANYGEPERVGAQALSPGDSDQHLPSTSTTRGQQQQQQHDTLHTSSSYTESNDVSSQISLIQKKKQQHVRKIHHHILTLEKLERVLLEKLGDSLGSEGSFKRLMTEGRRSHTESDSNTLSHHPIPEEGEIGESSSLVGSDSSEGLDHWQFKKGKGPAKVKQTRVQSGSASRKTHDPSKQTESASRHSHDPSKLSVSQATVESHTSSSRIGSQISSDLTSSRASTMRQVEDEVRRLASTEEKSRKVLQKPRGERHKSKEMKRRPLGPEIKNLTREEPRGEEDPVTQSRISLDPRSSTIQSRSSDQRTSREACVVGSVGVASTNRQPTYTQPLSEEEHRMPDAHVSQRGDGREARDRTQARKITTTQGRDRDTTSRSNQKKQSSSSCYSSNTSSVQRGPLRSERYTKDFGQMFPSTRNLVVVDSSNVCIQTGDSLLHLSRGENEVSASSSSSRSSSNTSTPTHSASTTSSSQGGRGREREESNKLDSARENYSGSKSHRSSTRSFQIVSTKDQHVKSVSRPGSGKKENTKDKHSHNVPPNEDAKKMKDKYSHAKTTVDKSHSKSTKVLAKSKPKTTREETKSQRRVDDNSSHRHKRPGSGTRSHVRTQQSDPEVIASSISEIERERSKLERERRELERMKSELERERSNQSKSRKAEKAHHGRITIDEEPTLESREESEHLSSEYTGTSLSEVLVNNDSPSSTIETSESTSTGEVGEAEEEDKHKQVTGDESREGELEDSVYTQRDGVWLYPSHQPQRDGRLYPSQQSQRDGAQYYSHQPQRDGAQYYSLHQSDRDVAQSYPSLQPQKDCPPSYPSHQPQRDGAPSYSLHQSQRDGALSYPSYQPQRGGDPSYSLHQPHRDSTQSYSSHQPHRDSTQSYSSHQPHSDDARLYHQGMQSTQLLEEEPSKLERVGHQAFIIPPPPVERRGRTDDQLHSERFVSDPTTQSGFCEEYAQRNANNQGLHIYGNQGKVTTSLDNDTSDTAPVSIVRKVIKQKKPVRFYVNVENKENFKPRHLTRTATERNLQGTSSKTTLSLQEALARAKPEYLREAVDRHALIRLKREMRQSAQHRNHELVAQIPPNLQTPSTLQRFLYKPDLSPLFTYQDIRQQNRRLYNLLPESGNPVVRQKHCAERRTNRLMASLYSQRLSKKARKGEVSHAHKEVVTPLPTRTKVFQPPLKHY